MIPVPLFDLKVKSGFAQVLQDLQIGGTSLRMGNF
jgi:hypothetical protein